MSKRRGKCTKTARSAHVYVSSFRMTLHSIMRRAKPLKIFCSWPINMLRSWPRRILRSLCGILPALWATMNIYVLRLLRYFVSWESSVNFSSAFQALCHMGLSYPDVLQSVIDKVTIKGDIFQATSSKVLQYHITLLSILAKRTKNRSMFMQVSPRAGEFHSGQIVPDRKSCRRSMSSTRTLIFSFGPKPIR